MEGRRILVAVVGIMMGIMPACWSYDFNVGGRDGWVPNPSVSFNQWAERIRFQLNDRLVFKYKNREDSVLVVKREDYLACKADGPIKRLEEGDSVFVLDHPGPFFFISGIPGRCQQGQKMVVVVMAHRDNKHAPLPSASSPFIPPSPSVAEPPMSGLAPVPAPWSASDDAAVSGSSVLSVSGVSTLVVAALALGGAFMG